MNGLIIRYVREFKDDKMTDPTMMYVNHEDWLNILVSSNHQSNRHLFLWDDSAYSPYSGELTVDATAYDDRTFLLKSIAAGSDLWEFVTGKLEIPDLSGIQFYHVKEVRVNPPMIEYCVSGIDSDGSVKLEPVGFVGC